VRRAELVLHLRVGRGALVAVGHVDADRGASGLAFVNTRDDGRGVTLFARSGDVALAGAAAIQLELNLFERDRQARRAAVDHDADAAAVALAPGRNTKKCAEGISHGSLRKVESGKWKVESGRSASSAQMVNRLRFAPKG